MNRPRRTKRDYTGSREQTNTTMPMTMATAIPMAIIGTERCVDGRAVLRT